MSFSANYPTTAPSLLLDFANSNTVDPRVTFTRASTATYFNSIGSLTTAAINSPRLDYDPTTLASQGLLIEEQRVNSIRNNTMVGAVAGTPGAICTNWFITPAGGNLTTVTIVGTGTESGIAYIDIRFIASGAVIPLVQYETNTQIAATAAQTWTDATYVRLIAGSLTNVTVKQRVEYRTSAGVFVNLQDLTIIPTSAGLATQRYTNSFLAVGGTIAAVTSGILPNFTGAGDITLRIGLPQLEQGAFATSVIPNAPTFTSRASTGTFFDSTGTLQTAAINVARNNYNPASLSTPPLLLIEEARTNLLTYSDQFDNTNWSKTDATVTANSVTSPDGTVNADKLIEGTLSTGHFVQQLVSITTATAYTGSIYVKAGERTTVDILVYRGATFGGLSVNLSTGAKATPQTAAVSDLSATSTVKAVANGYFIVSVPFTSDGVSGGLRVTLSNGSTTAYTGNGTSGLYIWGAQLEAGAYPTSVIPTTTVAVTRSADLFTQAAVTRSADVASVTTLSPWYNATEGALYVEWQSNPTSYARYLVSIEQAASQATRIDININAGNTVNPRTVVSGAAVATLTGGTYTAGTVAKGAFGYKSADYASSLNGAAAVTATTAGALPSSLATMYLGSITGTTQTNGYIRRIAYYPVRLSNANLQALTS